jgi:hypothetical protein
MATPNSKAVKMVAFRAMLSGLLKHFSGQTLEINNGKVAVNDLEATVNAIDAAATSAATAEASWKQQTETANKLIDGFEPQMVALRSFLRSRYGATSNLLLDFGVKPKSTKKVKTVATLSTAIEKSAATREARHTMGAKQKAKIHGTPAAVPTPTPAAPTTTGPKGS